MTRHGLRFGSNHVEENPCISCLWLLNSGVIWLCDLTLHPKNSKIPFKGGFPFQIHFYRLLFRYSLNDGPWKSMNQKSRRRNRTTKLPLVLHLQSEIRYNKITKYRYISLFYSFLIAVHLDEILKVLNETLEFDGSIFVIVGYDNKFLSLQW